MNAACQPSLCVAALGRGRWDIYNASGAWQFDAPPKCCALQGRVARRQASQLLRGRTVLFLGDSVARRHLWAFVDYLTIGSNRRTLPNVTRPFEGSSITNGEAKRAILAATGDTIYDEQLREKHSAQTVLVNARTRQTLFLTNHAICGMVGMRAAIECPSCTSSCVAPANRTHPNAFDNPLGARYDYGYGTSTGASTSTLLQHAIARTIAKIGPSRLQASAENFTRVLTVLTWRYASGISPVPPQVHRVVGPATIGFGADAIVICVDHTAVLGRGNAPLTPQEAHTNAHRALASLLAAASRPHRICAHKPETCIVRGVIANGYASGYEPYRRFADEAARVTSAARMLYLDPLNATWHGVHLGLLSHPDLMRIHFDDRGRELMAHLLLGALASALGPRKEQGEPAAEEEQAEDGDEEERAGYHLLVRSAPPIFRTVWRACLASPSALTAKLPIGTIPALRHACDLCGPACRNATLERKAAAADISPWQGDGVSDYAARSATHRQ